MKRRKPIKRRRLRTATEYNRIYGSKRRAKIMRERPCDTCGREPGDVPNQNSHVAPSSEKGLGYKGGWQWVITQCWQCHRALEYAGTVERFDALTGKDHRAIARRLAEEIKP